MAKVLASLIAASGLMATASAWGYGRTAFDGKHILQPVDYDLVTYNQKGKQLSKKKVRNGRCWIGSGIMVDKSHVYLSDFCSNNGWITRCPRYSNYQNCEAVARKAGYGGMAMSPLGKRLEYLARAARTSNGAPSNGYDMNNMRYVVWGPKNAGSVNGHCHLGFGIADMYYLNPAKNQMLFLKNQQSADAHMAVYSVDPYNRRCKKVTAHRAKNVCPGTQPQGVTFLSGRRRQGYLYFSCKGWTISRHDRLVKRTVAWGAPYTGILGEAKGPPTTTSTTTTSTAMPMVMKTWSFPEGLSWTIKKGKKTVCQGSKYQDWYSSIKIHGCKLSSGVYKVTCKDKFNEGWRKAELIIAHHRLCGKYRWGMGPDYQETLRLGR